MGSWASAAAMSAASCVVVEDTSDPAGKVVVGGSGGGAHPGRSGRFVFEFAQVGGDRPGELSAFGPEIEPPAGLDAGRVVLVLVAEVRRGPRPEGEWHGLAGVRSPGQHGAAGRPV